MKKIFRNGSAILMSLLMLVGAVACAGSNDPADVTTAAPEAASTAPEVTTESIYDENGYIKDDLDPSLNFGGDEFTLLYWSDREHEEFVAEEQTGDAVNDAIFQRNANVENRMGITFNYVTTKGNASNITNFVTQVENSYKSGDHSYDMIAAHSYTTASAAAKGLCLDLNTCDHLNWNKPWWPESLINEATINGKLFFASGDISANTIYMMYVTFFNKEMLDDRKLQSPYDLVANNQWTIDKMFELCSGIYEDSNQNGVADLGDLFGQYTYTLHLDAFLTGSGIRIVDTSGDAISMSEEITSDKTVDLTDKITRFFADNSQAFLITENKTVHQYFSANKSLFWNDRCRQAITFKNNEVSYGIVPIPKFDADQDNYCTVIGNPFSLYAIMIDAPDPDKDAAVMECYASESYRVLSPQLYETTMKYRFTDDAISSEMFDISRSTVIFDLGRIFSSSLSSPCGTWENCISGGVSWATKSKPLVKIWAKQTAELNSLFQ